MRENVELPMAASFPWPSAISAATAVAGQSNTARSGKSIGRCAPPVRVVEQARRARGVARGRLLDLPVELQRRARLLLAEGCDRGERGRQHLCRRVLPRLLDREAAGVAKELP